MHILITGANGFLGTKLARRLADEGHQIRAIVRKTVGLVELEHPRIELFQGDFTAPATLAPAMRGIDQVYHLAAIATDWAPDLRDFYRINVEGTLALLDAAKAAGVQKVLITSTAGTIGPPDPDHVVPTNEDSIRHVRFFTDYECSKIMMEERVQAYVKKGMNVVMVNPTRVYGPGPIERKNAYLMVIHSYLYKALAPYPAFKTQLGNMAFIDDIVDGHLLAMEKGRSGERYLLGGANVTFQDLFQTLEKLTGKRGRPVAIPVGLFKFWAAVNRIQAKLFKKAPMVTAEWIHKSSFSWPVSSQKAIDELGYAPHSYEDALRKTVAYIDEAVKAGKV
jgi:nucleoside-diphosphate-sugar epimerase